MFMGRFGRFVGTKLGWLNPAVGRLRSSLIGLPRIHKRLVIAVNDIVCLFAALWLVLAVRMNELYWPETVELGVMLALAPGLAIVAFNWFGAYRVVTRYIGPGATLRVVTAFGASIMVWALLILVTGIGIGSHGFGSLPRSTPVAYFITGAAFLLASRSLAGWLLYSRQFSPYAESAGANVVLVYGAGPAGNQVKEALLNSGSARVAAFFDDDPSLGGQYVGGVKVYAPDPAKIAKVIAREDATEIIVAAPHLPRARQQAILSQLQGLPVRVRILPSLVDLASGRVTVSDIRPVQVEDLLGRDPVPANAQLLERCITGKSVMITGAGGSIGSELVRQIARLAPKRIVLFELSEPALYEIETELTDVLSHRSGDSPFVVAVLGSVLDRPLLERTMRENEVEVVFHAAAYKHVPIVEANAGAGILNNTFGTEAAALAARAIGVERFVLISTDKAVRPTNVMGASKRLAELVLQAHAADPTCETIFTMVRFGNVLDSSGSVVRRFRKQIEAGGPVTVTHPEVTRYFMSIPEAAELVLQAGAMGKGGDVFLLDMGQPVKIDDLARAMVKLAGLDVRDGVTPSGDIEIVYSGLRPGEKLYEELLIGAGAVATEHSRIMRHNEAFLPLSDIEARLRLLKDAIARRDVVTLQAILRTTVEGYQPPATSLWATVDPGDHPTVH
jgi:FlaA1/EpsC-like NDP-sugar epimerase